MNSLSYKETLVIVEKFMIASNIREYCTKICKGKCCMGCYTDNPKSCRHCEEKRLTCSIYLCFDMLEFFSAEDRIRLTDSSKLICDQYDLYYKLRCCNKSVYFTTPNKVFFRIVRFPMLVKLALEEIDTKKIKTKIDRLIKKNKQIHC